MRETADSCIVLDVLGIPRAQARPRGFVSPGGARVYSPKTPWHTLVQFAAMERRARGEICLSGPTRVVMEFRMPRVSGLPKSREIPHTKKPDLDNTAKGTLDSLVPILLATDSQVVELVVRKRYALVGEAPGCKIEMTSPSEKMMTVGDD